MSKQLGLVAAVGLLLFCVGAAFGDTLVTTSGKVYEGELISQSNGVIVFEVHKYGSVYRKTFNEEDVESITKGKKKPSKKSSKGKKTSKQSKAKKPDGDMPAKPKAPKVVENKGATYYIIPLEGMVGKTFVASVLEESLEDALKRKPSAVILEIDSPGGLVSEVTKLADVIRRYSEEVRLVVFAKDAISAAAITSLAVKEIYMKPGGRFGAATAWRAGASGKPTAVGEKFQSVWRATARSIAEQGGHSPLFGDAMIDANEELHWVDEKGKKVVKKGRGKNMITARGKLLTMTARETVKCGLAKGVALNIDELGKALGYEGWKECKGYAVPLAKWRKESLKVAEKQFKEHFEKFEKYMSTAKAKDPRNSDYVVYRGGCFTPASKRKWKRRARACCLFLARAGKELKKAAKLAEEFPGLLSDPDSIRNKQKMIDSLREEIYNKMDKQGMSRK